MPVVVLHGLFGSSDNWMTQARLMSVDRVVHTLDLRNHGLSPHAAAFDYDVMASDVMAFIRKLPAGKAILVGHSMGGKVAMQVAVSEPALVHKLVVVDMVPKAYPPHHDRLVEGLRTMPLDQLTSRQDADNRLAAYVPDPGVRQFLLKNLSRSSEGFSWKMNLPVIAEKLPHILDNPVQGKFTGPVLFIMGSRSDYFRAEDRPILAQHFPLFELVQLDTGHWVQAEKPNEFVDAVLKFIRA